MCRSVVDLCQFGQVSCHEMKIQLSTHNFLNTVTVTEPLDTQLSLFKLFRDFSPVLCTSTCATEERMRSPLTPLVIIWWAVELELTDFICMMKSRSFRSLRVDVKVEPIALDCRGFRRSQ